MTHIHDRLDWNLLRTFVAIVQEGSISKAATRLHLTQPAVSLALKRLEETLNEVLIARTHNQFVLTTTGEMVYREAIAISGSINRLSINMRNVSGDLNGTVRLGLVSGVQSPLLDEVLTTFHQRYPRVHYEILSGSSRDVQSALLHYDAGLGICLKRGNVPCLSNRLFRKQQYYLYCGRSHPLFGRKDLTLSDIRQESFVIFSSAQHNDNGVMAPIALFRAQQEFTGEIIGTCTSISEIHRMLRAGIGVGAIPAHLAHNEVAAGALWQLPPQEGVAEINLYLMWHQAPRFSNAEIIFFEMLQQALHEQHLH